MNTTERQQSLAAARRACEWLRALIKEDRISPRLLADIGELLKEFTRLDEKEQKQAAQGKHGQKGAAHGVKGAEFGKLGGWPKGKPRKPTKKGKA